MAHTQMPPVTPEDEEGACHSEAEAGDIFSCKHKHQIKGHVSIYIDNDRSSVLTYCLLPSDDTVAEASRSSRTRGEFMEVTRIASMGGSSKGGLSLLLWKSIVDSSSFAQLLVCPFAANGVCVSVSLSVRGFCTVWCLCVQFARSFGCRWSVTVLLLYSEM
jgi:hypothetical protein